MTVRAVNDTEKEIYRSFDWVDNMTIALSGMIDDNRTVIQCPIRVDRYCLLDVTGIGHDNCSSTLFRLRLAISASTQKLNDTLQRISLVLTYFTSGILTWPLGPPSPPNISSSSSM